MEKTHELVIQLITPDYEREIIVFSGTEENCNYMLNWYKAHREFFNGEFIIREKH